MYEGRDRVMCAYIVMLLYYPLNKMLHVGVVVVVAVR